MERKIRRDKSLCFNGDEKIGNNYHSVHCLWADHGIDDHHDDSKLQKEPMKKSRKLLYNHLCPQIYGFVSFELLAMLYLGCTLLLIKEKWEFLCFCPDNFTSPSPSLLKRVVNIYRRRGRERDENGGKKSRKKEISIK